jgi:hypothetical protein
VDADVLRRVPFGARKALGGRAWCS